jgi:hypothetical protein
LWFKRRASLKRLQPPWRTGGARLAQQQGGAALAPPSHSLHVRRCRRGLISLPQPCASDRFAHSRALYTHTLSLTHTHAHTHTYTHTHAHTHTHTPRCRTVLGSLPSTSDSFTGNTGPVACVRRRRTVPISSATTPPISGTSSLCTIWLYICM